MTRRTLPVYLLAGLLATPALTLAQPTSATILRDATGARKTQLKEMELKAFPTDAWGKLSGWTMPGGETAEPITAASYDGKPVLIFTWASWHRAALPALNTAKQMADTYGPQGLIVVGVHHQNGFDKAAETAKSKGANFLLAHDAQGEFRKALKIDHEPDWYLIDRAGHLRYAAVSTASVGPACAELTKETATEAKDLPGIIAKRNEEEAAAGRRFTDINMTAVLNQLPDPHPGWEEPGEEAYEAVKGWPKMNTELAKEIGMMDQQTNKLKTPTLNFTPEGYYPKEPNKAGRATVIYFWHAEEHRSFTPVMQRMDLLQQQYPRDLAVIGAMVPLSALDPSYQQQQGANAEEDQEKLMKKYQNFIKSRKFSHALAADLTGSSIFSINGAQSGGVQKFPLPGAMVVSSDGIIRWVGWSDTSDFKYAIDTVLANDPSVIKRRELDRKYIEEKIKK